MKKTALCTITLLVISNYIGFKPAYDNMKNGLSLQESESKILNEYRKNYCNKEDTACDPRVLGELVGVPGRGLGYMTYHINNLYTNKSHNEK